ncbi:YceI family protein [Pedobacter duraquae]|uniref:Polyisoprenoid-binding protein YceI n=1 Tax=Pedobacter duraquae TaxID=425511 RepID=A0A4R6IP61_9SPHI|nr:YceI family protein [Pedobacter duraquae]TDO23786.1 polyisoprenoid-binding protein YceI [Pedobacter duraquae]
MTNQKLSICSLILFIAILASSCREPQKKENKNVAQASTLSLHTGDERYLMIDSKESVIKWKGSSLNGLNAQAGYIYLSKGELRIENGQLVGGTVEVDMNTIEDKNHGRDNKLVNHLKDPDFFEVKRFPFSTISITRVNSVNSDHKQVTANLTIKGITKPVAFQTKTEITDETIKANAKLVIDRTKWDVRYKSAKFYANLANQTMSDSIEFDIQIVAKK